MTKTRDQMEIDARKHIMRVRKKETEDAVRERQHIQAELEKDKKESSKQGEAGDRAGYGQVQS